MIKITLLVCSRILPKRISVRIEHVKHSQCRKDFLDRSVTSSLQVGLWIKNIKMCFPSRVKANEVKKTEAKETGVRGAPCKR